MTAVIEVVPLTNGNDSLYKLPREVIHDILTLLPFVERFICASTCKTWRDLILTSTGLWYEIYLTDPIILKRFLYDNRLAQSASKQVRVVNFTFHSSGRRAQKIVKQMLQNKWSNIRSLTLTNFISSEIALTNLLIMNKETLDTLYLENGGPATQVLLEAVFMKCYRLKHLTYIDNGHSGMNRHFNIPRSQTLRLTSLCIHCDKMLEGDMLPQVLRLSPLLKNLELHDTRESRDSIMYDGQDLLKFVHTYCHRISSIYYSRTYHVVNNGMKNGMWFKSDSLDFRYHPYIGAARQDDLILPWVNQSHTTITSLSLAVCLTKPHHRALDQLSVLGVPQLRELELYCLCDTTTTQCSAFSLQTIIGTCPRLEKLRSHRLDVIDDNILQILGGLSNLRHLEIELGSSASAITSQGMRWLFNEKCKLDIAIFGGKKNYFTDEHLIAVASHKRLQHLGLRSGSCLTTEGICSFTELMQDSDLEYLELGRSPAVGNKGIISLGRLSKLRRLELNVFMKGLRVNIILKLFETRSSTHTLAVQYFNGIKVKQLSSDTMQNL
ncbi:hypothetical protein BJV82DRAFT_596731 [Fennellomyces sp. T-0311]|nr:hypothetical protein BJV82DRAFT_596731 [Fennellomyces sp. T-0311]